MGRDAQVKPRVTFRAFDERYASTRLRALIPQRELAAVGVEPGRDILVIGKHRWDWDTETRGYKRVVFDICDSHWTNQHGPHYIETCKRADAVTCNSAAMRDEIKHWTGRDAWVIPDPYETPEGKARVSDKLIWYGHASNLADLDLDALVGRQMTIVTNLPSHEVRPGVQVVTWSPEAQERAFAQAGLAVIPTGKSMAKSGNRAIEAIRRGVFPVCGYLPAYGDLGVYVGDIREGVEWALSHHDETLRRIRAAQDYVRWQYSPARIAKLWLEALSYV